MPVRTTRDGAVAVITIDNPPVNALSAPVRRDLLAAVEAAFADRTAEAVVLTGAGRTFVAGADISEFGKPPVAPTIADVIARLEAAPKPVVAALNGAALGGGMELALACHRRVASTDAAVGLPEIKLGLIPGAGGTQRLPSLIGAVPAFAMMLDGEPRSATEAARLGAVDRVVEDDLLAAAAAEGRTLGGAPPRRPSRPGSEQRAPFEAAAGAALARHRDMPNVAALAEAVRGGFDLPPDEALRRERALFVGLVADDRSRALRHLFFAERAVARVAGVGRDTPRKAVEAVAVVGAGTMGAGIAAACANAGLPVVLVDSDQAALDRGMGRIRAAIDSAGRRGGLAADEAAARLARVAGSVALADAGRADLVIEAVFEDLALKQDVFRRLDAAADAGAILATNTSYLDIDGIAGATARPGRVVGLHFFSPANVMRLVEVVRGRDTEAETLATAIDFAKRIGKLPVVVGNAHGFVGNRMLSRRSEAGERLLLEGALPEEVDAALEAFGFRMGPFAVADLAGLDISWRMRRANNRTAAVGDALCEAGRFGQKAGRGYYRYEEGSRAPLPDPAVAELLAGLSAGRNIARRHVPAEEIVERLLFPMVNEGARILEEGIAERAGDVDVIWANGYGFPRWRGGPMFHADTVGLPQVADRLRALAAASGDRSLEPAPLLVRLAAENGRFTG